MRILFIIHCSSLFAERPLFLVFLFHPNYDIRYDSSQTTGRDARRKDTTRIASGAWLYTSGINSTQVPMKD